MASLEIVPYDHPIMSKELRQLSPDEIRSDRTKEIVAAMLSTMREKNGVGLAASQIGVDAAIIVVEDLPEYQAKLPPEYLELIDRYPVPADVLFNPSFSILDPTEICLFEGCLCRPEVVGVVPSPKWVYVKALTSLGEPVTFTASGYLARILRHEIQHCFGIQYFSIALPDSIIPTAEYREHWLTATPDEIAKAFDYPLLRDTEPSPLPDHAPG